LPDAADVVAEVFLVAWRRRREMPPEAEVRLWLYGVARRVLANYHRGGVRRERLGERLRQRLKVAVGVDPGSEVPDRVTVQAALARLGELDREVLMLTFWEGLEPREAAVVLQVSSAAVRTRLSRARARLRDLVGDDLGPPRTCTRRHGRTHPGGGQMTDKHLDRMVRDADPYRPDVIRHLDGAAQNLLEEIMSTPTLDRVAEPPGTRRLRARRGIMSGLVGASVAATVLAGVLVVSTMKPDQPGGRQASPATSSSSEATGTTTYSAMVLKAAEQNPRLLIDQPGWKATTVQGFAEETGEISFSNGGRQLTMNWFPAGRYDDFHEDRLRVSKPESVKVDGWPGDLFRYSASDFAVMLQPRSGSFVELRTVGAWTRGDFDRVLADVVHVNVRTWLAALPAEIVTPQRVDERAAKVLADVPLPPGFDPATLNDLGTYDDYQFGFRVTRRVGCGWIAEWLRAKKAGDDAALKRAADALRSSHKWKVLHQMNDEGDWPEALWETADTVAAGNTPRGGYGQTLGCE
jgi:RNA polymerase sigma factor (sigma-70 family)